MQQDHSQWRPVAKIQIAKNCAFMGPGCQELLTRIQTSGSVRMACEGMGLSYSKAWKILNTLETEAGFSVVTRKQGGNHGGETKLTRDGLELLEKYNAFEAECKAAIGDVFARYFAEGLEEES